MTAPRSFDGNTWVAFLDFAGFKKLAKDTAYRNLSDFYQIAYSEIDESGHCKGLVISDCIILWSNRHSTPKRQLSDVLPTVERICKKCLSEDILIIGAVAYGDFRYDGLRIQHRNIRKEMFLGKAYFKAFAETEGTGKPNPGEVRVVMVPKEILEDQDFLEQNRLKPRTKKSKKLQFYWNLSSLADIKPFRRVWKHCEQIEFDERRRVLRRWVEGASNMTRELPGVD